MFTSLAPYSVNISQYYVTILGFFLSIFFTNTIHWEVTPTQEEKNKKSYLHQYFTEEGELKSIMDFVIYKNRSFLMLIREVELPIHCLHAKNEEKRISIAFTWPILCWLSVIPCTFTPTILTRCELRKQFLRTECPAHKFLKISR